MADEIINMDDMNKEYDVNAEKQKLIQAEVQRLTGIYGANSKEVKALRNRYKEFEVQGASAFDIINNKAEVFGQMGKEFDSVKEKMSILESQITSMIDAGIHGSIFGGGFGGLGEMKNLATGVGDLKKVLTNVKTRGTWGEYQLGNILEQKLTKED